MTGGGRAPFIHRFDGKKGGKILQCRCGESLVFDELSDKNAL
jgi:hypothetical protein